MEGFGARYLQLLEVYDKVVTRYSRPLVLVSNVNDHHHSDLHDKEISLCDILTLPPTVSCVFNKSFDIIRTEKCQTPKCAEEDWYFLYRLLLHMLLHVSLCVRFVFISLPSSLLCAGFADLICI